ncbi:MAG: diguanylate cyclase [Lachnospiraceae bacterium]|nr:diguanylate cyclase [Lachnospiraceae bacterium]
MQKIWEFFENMNELVYVSDMDSHELLYMNKKAREMYNFASIEDLEGRKCHELIQGSKAPCAMCNNKDLEQGYFKEWSYYNPQLNRHFILKDTMIQWGDRRCRMELAFDNTIHQQQSRMIDSYQKLESLANEGMRVALQAATPDQSLEVILEYLGNALKGERTYIFERNAKGNDDNTYEWVANGVEPAKDMLQDLPAAVCTKWYQDFREDKNIMIHDLEDIRESDPLQYENLKRQSIHALVVVPLYFDKKIIGFYGVDNPPKGALDYAETMLQILAHFIVSSIRRRELLKQLQNMSFRDRLTQLGNRFAMDEYVRGVCRDESIGVVYCDITGLKRINDSQGHEAGDRLILHACDCLREVFGRYGLFRTGGDELLALCPGIAKDALNEKVELLKAVMPEHGVIMAVGAVWCADSRDGIDRLLSQADRLMYEDKAAYYKKHAVGMYSELNR